MALVVTSAEAPAPLLPFASPDGGASAVAAACRVRGTPEAREGFAAFLAKRPPNWIPQ